MKRVSFKFYRSYYDVFNELEKDSDKVAFLDAIFKKHFFNKDPDFKSGICRLAYKSIEHSLSSQVNGFISKWGDIEVDNTLLVEGVAQGVSHNDKDNGNDKGKEKGNTQFVKPTQTQILEYCKERKNNIDPEKFFNFYESKGWMVGKNKMKDWKACVRTWEKTNTLAPLKKLTNKEEGNEW